MVQNKMHFAVHGATAAEVISDRADSEKDFMGLTTFNGYLPNKEEIVIAKNYLSKEELSDLNHLVAGYLEFAENRAQRHIPMYMNDWVSHIDKVLSSDDRELLRGAGNISHEQAVEIANEEYEKFRERVKLELTPVEKHFIENLKQLEQIEKK
jgi:hypothetical protein